MIYVAICRNIDIDIYILIMNNESVIKRLFIDLLLLILIII
jgi:hypothetical protein